MSKLKKKSSKVSILPLLPELLSNRENEDAIQRHPIVRFGCICANQIIFVASIFTSVAIKFVLIVHIYLCTTRVNVCQMWNKRDAMHFLCSVFFSFLFFFFSSIFVIRFHASQLHSRSDSFDFVLLSINKIHLFWFFTMGSVWRPKMPFLELKW